jgi:hypothetical protein
MERYASQPDAAMYYLARMVEADEDPKFIARRMAIFASALRVPSGRGHAAPASLVNLKKLGDRVSMNKRMNRASIPPEAAILVEVGSHRPHKVVFDAFGPFKILWVITNGTMRRNFLWITLRKTGIYVASGDTLVGTGGEFLRGLQGSKGRTACLRPRRPCQPFPKPHKVQGCGSRQMLHMGLGEPTIARLPEATPANTLRVGALDAGSRGVLTLEGFGGLPLPRRLQRLIRLALLESQEAWLLLCPGTLRPARARRAILPGKADLPCHAILVGVWEPGDALLTHGARHDLAVPIDEQLGFVKASASAGLPTGVVSDGADECDPRRPLALDQDLRVCIALIHQGLGRE